jgi:branched-chain amino acid transport system substrate-binding protein
MKLRNIGVLATVAVVAFSSTACNLVGGGKTVNFAIELPQQGSEKAASDPIINGIKLAVKDAGAEVGGWKIEIPNSVIKDDALNGVHDPQTGAANMGQLVAIPEVVGVIGPLNSNVGAAQIPISSAAGLAQCSPANTNPDLTKGEAATQLRGGKPNNYIRVVTTDDVQGPAAAVYIYETLGAKSVYIIDDTEIFGKGVADTFEVAFEEAGGTVVQRDGAPRTTQDYVSLMTAAAALDPEAIYFGGVTASGGARIYQAAQQAGLADIPYVGPDGINDGDAITPDSFLNIAGDAAEENVYSTLAGIGTFEGKEAFDAAYQAEYGISATGYAAQGYTCAQIFLDALERAAATNPADLAAMREAMRVAITDTSITYDTIQGDITFDEFGDTSQLIVSIYSVENGSWLFETQVDYAIAAE